MADASDLKSLIARAAGEAGFTRVGIAPAGPAARADRFAEFIARGYHAEMSWLARDPARRCDARGVLDGAASVICLAASYAPADEDAAAGHVARYARGRDYHRLLRKRCRHILAAILAVRPDVRAKVCVDTSPLVERDLAASAGLGWIGRNGCLIDRRFGSYLVLAEIVTDLPLPPDGPVPGRCGRCRRCVEACPTGAIGPLGLVDSRRCVSYLTIEHRGEVPAEFCGAIAPSVFGCDICQAVCPFNRPWRTPLDGAAFGSGPQGRGRGKPAGDTELIAPTPIARATPEEMLCWTEADWDRLTRGSATRRAGHEMFLRNAALACDRADGACRAALRRLAGHPSPPVARAARWAMSQGV